MLLRSRLPLLAVLLFASAVHADPLEIDTDFVGPRWEGANFHDNFGWHVVSPGDLDGDGKSDFLAAGPQDDGPVTFDSTLRVFLGTEDIPQQRLSDWSQGSFIDAGAADDAVFTFAVIPDATGDGEPDLLVAEPNAGDRGLVLMYAGDGSWDTDRTAADSAARWVGYVQTEYPELAPETRPSAVAGADFDGDGLSDIVIASVLFNRVWIDYSADGFGAETDLSSLGSFFTSCSDDFPGAGFGSSLAVGDLNGDGNADLAVGAPGCNSDAGEVHVWYGDGQALDASADLVIPGGDRIGNRVFIEDLDGDGLDDLFVQELQTGAGTENHGGLWIFFGAQAGLGTVPNTRIRAAFSDRRLGAAVAVLQDISNPADGLLELVISSPEASYSGVGQGAVYVFEGVDPWPAEVQVSDAKYRIDGANLNSWFGQSVATLDDFNGDGYPEIVIGEPNFSAENTENEFHRGRVYLVTALPDRDIDGDGISTLGGDCDDTDFLVRPGGVEECNGYDDDCDHEVDEGCGDDDDDDSVGDDDTAGDDDTGGDDDDGCDCASSAAGPSSPLSGLALALIVGFVGLLRVRRCRA